MYLKRCGQTRTKKDSVYWELVESYRTERGSRQRVGAYLGDVSEGKRFGVQQAAKSATGSWQNRLFDEEGEPDQAGNGYPQSLHRTTNQGPGGPAPDARTTPPPAHEDFRNVV